MTDLDKLIEAIEAGTLTGESELSYPIGMAEMIDAALDRNVWECAAVAHDGSLDAARELHDALLPGWVYNLAPGFCHVFPPNDNGEQEALTGEHEDPARAWLLAILRAYRATKEQ